MSNGQKVGIGIGVLVGIILLAFILSVNSTESTFEEIQFRGRTAYGEVVEVNGGWMIAVDEKNIHPQFDR